MGKPVIKNYSLKRDGRKLYYYQIDEEPVVNAPKVNNQKETINVFNDVPIIPGNPFIYDQSNINSTASIENYMVTYKGKETSLGSIIYDQHIRFSKKKKFVKKTFLNWDKEFVTNKQSIVKTTNDSISITGSMEFPKTSVTEIIIVFIILAIIGFFVILPDFFVNFVSQVGFFKSLTETLKAEMANNMMFKIFGYASVALLALQFVYLIAYNITSSSFRSFNRKYENDLKRKNELVDRNYKKRYKKAFRYYMKHINARCKPFKPLMVSEIQNKVNVNTLEQIQKKFHSEAVKKHKVGKKMKKLKYLLYFILILVLGYFLYLVIMLFI